MWWGAQHTGNIQNLQRSLAGLHRYVGHVTPCDISDALKQFAIEGAQYQNQPHFFDLSNVTGFSIDYPQVFQLMGQLADVYPQATGEHLFVFYAPDGPPADLSEILRKPFAGSPTLMVRIAPTREQAFDILGSERPDVLEQLYLTA